ncbi:MAG: hydrogenase maturation protease, partial [Syntrophales bacterium]|nr:hydrogenase maturation protease [Syntrophales bacterium]
QISNLSPNAFRRRMKRTLVIGYGNFDRADDGVAYGVINSLRRRLGLNELPEEETGLDDLGRRVDSVFLTQLTPELMDLLAGYDRIVFVDAHINSDPRPLQCSPVVPEAASLTFTHHITPALLLALMQALLNREPAGYLVSIRGYDFDFHRGLSPQTESQVSPAVDSILKLVGDDS